MGKIVKCDVDGVVADLYTPWLAVYNRIYNDGLTVDDITAWHLADFTHPLCGDRIFDLLRPELYWDMPPVAGALEAIETIRAEGHRVIFVTSCCLGTLDAKVDWLQRTGFLPRRERTPKDFIAIKHKQLVKGDLLIDDGLHNVTAEVGAGMDAVIFDRPWNRDGAPAGAARITGWHELDVVLELLA